MHALAATYTPTAECQTIEHLCDSSWLPHKRSESEAQPSVRHWKTRYQLTVGKAVALVLRLTHGRNDCLHRQRDYETRSLSDARRSMKPIKRPLKAGRSVRLWDMLVVQ